MNEQRYFFSLSIHSVNRQKHETDQEAAYQSVMSRQDLPSIQMKLHLAGKNHQPWKFNTVLGWLALYAKQPNECGGEIRGDLWRVDAKRFGLNTVRKRYFVIDRKFHPGGTQFAIHVEHSETNQEIFDTLKREIQAITKEGIFKGKIVDITELENVGPFIDWRNFLKLSST